MTDFTIRNFLLLKTLILDVIDLSIDNQTNLSDIEESISESFDEIKEQLQELESEIDERLSFLERRIVNFLDSYEDSIIKHSGIIKDDCEELPFN